MNGQSSTIPAFLAVGTAGLTKGTSLLGHGDPRLSDFADVEARYRAERRLVAAEHGRLLRRLRQERRTTRAADRAAAKTARTAKVRDAAKAAHPGHRGQDQAGQHAEHKSASLRLAKVLSGWTAWSSPTPEHRSSAERQSSSICGN